MVWDVSNEEDLEKSSMWFGSRLPETFYTYGTPQVAACAGDTVRTASELPRASGS